MLQRTVTIRQANHLVPYYYPLPRHENGHRKTGNNLFRDGEVFQRSRNGLLDAGFLRGGLDESGHLTGLRQHGHVAGIECERGRLNFLSHRRFQ